MNSDTLTHSLFRKDIQPFILWLVWLLALTLIIDYLLHQTRLTGFERYSGILGTLLIVISFAYSLRKKKIITFGKPKVFLIMHKYLAWTGSLMVLVHGGIHFNGILAWAAAVTMLVAVISGLVGKHLLKKSTDTLNAKKGELVKEGLSNEEIEKKIFWDSLAVKTMQKWRTVHKPITIMFGIFATLHILTIFLFWRWN
jgi:hypothetical protein